MKLLLTTLLVFVFIGCKEKEEKIQIFLVEDGKEIFFNGKSEWKFFEMDSVVIKDDTVWLYQRYIGAHGLEFEVKWGNVDSLPVWTPSPYSDSASTKPKGGKIYDSAEYLFSVGYQGEHILLWDTLPVQYFISDGYGGERLVYDTQKHGRNGNKLDETKYPTYPVDGKKDTIDYFWAGADHNINIIGNRIVINDSIFLVQRDGVLFMETVINYLKRQKNQP